MINYIRASSSIFSIFHKSEQNHDFITKELYVCINANNLVLKIVIWSTILVLCKHVYGSNLDCVLKLCISFLNIMIPFEQKQSITSSICSSLHWTINILLDLKWSILFLFCYRQTVSLFNFHSIFEKCCTNPCGSDIIEQDYNKPNIRNFVYKHHHRAYVAASHSITN